MKTTVQLLKEALVSVKENNHLKAIELLNSALELQNTNNECIAIYLQLGICYSHINKLEEAEEMLLKCLQLGKSEDVYGLLLLVYEKGNNVEKGIEICGELAKYYDFNKSKDFLEIDFYTKVGEYGKAIDLCNKLNNDGEYSFELVTCQFNIYKNMLELQKAFSVINTYITVEQNEVKRNVLLLGKFLPISIYDIFYSDDEYIELINRHMEFTRPKTQNKFNINKNLFRNIRVGLLSHDFRIHPVGVFILSLFNNSVDITGLSFYCYDTNASIEDEFTKGIMERADVYKSIASLNSLDMEQEIINDKIDILFDLDGMSKENRLDLFAKRLAPIQISWIGYPASSATANMDYTIVDEKTDPKGISEKFYSEKLIYMTNTFLCYPLEMNIKIEDLPFNKNGFITFGCFHNGLKYTNYILQIWGKILGKLPNSKLIILCANCNNFFIKEKLVERFVSNGISRDRFEIMQQLPYLDYFKQYNEVDIMLDTYPFNGATTTCDALYMGVPIITLVGNRHVSRVGLSMLSNVGLKDFITYTEEDYIEKAIEMANNVERLVYLRGNLRELFIKSPLADTASFKVEMEFKLREIFVSYCLKNGKDYVSEDIEINELYKEILLSFRFLKYAYEEKNLNISINDVKNEAVILLEMFCKMTRKIYHEDASALLYIDSFAKTIRLLKNAKRYEDVKLLIELCFKCIIELTA